MSEPHAMRLLRRLFAPIALLLIVLFLSSCSDDDAAHEAGTADTGGDLATGTGANLAGGDREEEPSYGGIFTFLSRQDPQTLNNLIRTGGRSRLICRFLFPPLLDYDMRDGTLRPFTAAALPEMSDDGHVYTWQLRKGIKWHDFETSGAYLTARDVKFSFDLLRNEKVMAGESFEGLEEIRVVDDLTFQTVFREVYFNSFYTFGRKMRIMAAHLYESVPPEELNTHPCGRAPVGYGLFRFHHWDTGREVLITRFDPNREAFPEAVRPWIDGIRWKAVADRSLEFLLFEKGEFDIFNMSPDDFVLRTKSDEFKGFAETRTYYIPYFNYIGWNPRTVFFGDRRVRQAMAHALRRDRVLETHLYGRGKVLSAPVYYFADEYDRSIDPFPHDLEKARALLAEAGWKDSDGNGILDREVDGERHEFRFEFLTRPSRPAYMNALLRAFIEDLKSLGIVMELRTIEFSACIAQINERRFDAYDLANSSDPLYEDYFDRWHSSQIDNPNGGNRVSYANPRVDAILEEVRVAHDGEKRRLLMHEFHAILHEDQPMTPLFSQAVNMAVNRRWRNLRVYDGFGLDPYEWWLPRANRTDFDRIPALRDR